MSNCIDRLNWVNTLEGKEREYEYLLYIIACSSNVDAVKAAEFEILFLDNEETK